MLAYILEPCIPAVPLRTVFRYKLFKFEGISQNLPDFRQRPDPAAGHGNIFKTLIDLKTCLQNNDTLEISATMDKLDEHLETVSNMISDTGGKIIRMEVKENIIKDLELNHSDRKSQLEDADMADAVMNLKTKELAYQAALSSSAKVMSLSLVNYL